jgi:hypothetical protein
MGDNGAVKNPEELAKERLLRYQADPQSFVEVSEIIACAVKTPGIGLGVAIYIGNCKRSELDITWAELNTSMLEKLVQFRAEGAADNKPKILPGPHGVMDFIRGKR